MPDWAAILMSTFAVVIVAEIVPMSYTTGPSKYKVAYFCAPLVNVCIKVYYVIAYPIARGLDRLLGVHDDTHIKRADFLAFVNDKKKVILLIKIESSRASWDNHVQSVVCGAKLYKCSENYDTSWSGYGIGNERRSYQGNRTTNYLKWSGLYFDR